MKKILPILGKCLKIVLNILFKTALFLLLIVGRVLAFTLDAIVQKLEEYMRIKHKKL